MTKYKIRYEERKQAGLCVRCGQTSPIENETQCQQCKAYFAERRKNMTDKQRKQRTEAHRKWQQENTDRLKRRDERYRSKLKNDIFSHYGHSCACCGEITPEFLTLDHINGGGNKHRIELFGKPQAGNAFYRKIRKMGFPEGFQTLCWNCNMAKAHYGICPHQHSK